MYYTFLFLPSDLPFTDGCNIIDQSGNLHAYDETHHTPETKRLYRVAEPWLVSTQFNKQEPMWRPSPKALKWLKSGDQVKVADTEVWIYSINEKRFISRMEEDDNIPEPKSKFCVYARVKCPMCGDLH